MKTQNPNSIKVDAGKFNLALHALKNLGESFKGVDDNQVAKKIADIIAVFMESIKI